MSKDIEIFMKFTRKIDFRQFIMPLIENGWRIDFSDEISYLLTTQEDKYEWKVMQLHKDSAKNTGFVSKLLNDDALCGILLVTNEFNSGGNFILNDSGDSISMIVNINRLILNNNDQLVDFSFYLSHLEPALHAIDSDLLVLECSMSYI